MILLSAFCGLATSVFNPIPTQFPPMSEETHEMIIYRTSAAKQSVGMVKMYLEEIACYSDDPRKVNAAVERAMMYLWNVDCCLGEDEYSGIKCYTATIPKDELDEDEDEL